MKLAQRMENIEFSPIRKFHPYALEARKRGIKIYNFNIGQPDIETPEVFMNSVKMFCDPVLEYLPSQGLPELISKVREYHERYGMPFTDEDIFITSGGSEALSFVFGAIFDKDDQVIIAEPFYTNYRIFLSYFDAKIVPVKSHAEEGYKYVNREKIVNLITDKTKAILVNTPSNPTGNVLTADEMKIILEIAKEHDLYVIADEVYREFVYDGASLSSFGQHIDGYEKNLIIVDSISKRFSACGARIGTIITKNDEIKEAVMQLLQARLSAPTLEQYGALALYKLPPDYFETVRKEYEHRRDVAFEEINKIEGVICKKPGGSFYITMKLPVLDAEDFQLFMLNEFDYEKETVMFAPASGFYETEGRGRREIRIAYVLNSDSIKRGMKILRYGLDAYKKARGI